MSGLLSDPVVMTLAVALCSLAALLLAGAAGSNRSRAVARRIETVRRASAFSVAPAVPRASPTLRRKERGGRFGMLSQWLASLLPRTERLKIRLEQAGLDLGLADLVIASTALAVISAILLRLLGLPAAAAAPFGATLGIALPALYITLRKRRRSARFLSLLPEAIDLVVRAVKSGLPVSEAIALIGEEIADPVGEVFREVASNMRIGMTPEEALWAAVRRVDVAEFRFLVVSITLQRETGGNLAGILQNLAAMVRRREQMKLKVQAMSSEARASAMIIGSLPFVVGGVIFLVNPDYIMKLFVDPRGQLVALGGLTSMVVGIGVIARMVRFEI